MPFGIQPWHLVVVLIVALLIFGPARLPQLGKNLGKFFKDLRAGAHDMSTSFKEGIASMDDQAPLSSPSELATGESPKGTGQSGPVAGNFCTSCGAPNPPTARFCNACGKSVKG